jgi:NAD(P)-dependent dehydrogenase (short-subunit alcohol dehydrogenase family)
MEDTTRLLAGKHALVTGGARGIGAAITRALLEQGARVTMLGRTPEAKDGSGVAAGAQAEPAYFQADVAEPVKVAQAFTAARARFGPIAILVNNAGQARSAPFMKTDSALWRSMMQVNLDGAFYCTQAALPEMLEAGWGRIINIASTAGLVGYSYVTAYCAAKHGLIGLTRALALEVATKGISVNSICPGFTETDMLKETLHNIVSKTGRTEAEARAELAARNPQRRMVQPEEIANAVLWLCLPGSESVTGQAIAVAGGEVM